MKEIIETMTGQEMSMEEGGIRWVTLLAQMQSGKTEAYLLVACEMYRRGRVDGIAIFSGNSETDLKQQLEVIIHGKHQVKIDTEKLKLTNENI